MTLKKREYKKNKTDMNMSISNNQTTQKIETENTNQFESTDGSSSSNSNLVIPKKRGQNQRVKRNKENDQSEENKSNKKTKISNNLMVDNNKNKVQVSSSDQTSLTPSDFQTVSKTKSYKPRGFSKKIQEKKTKQSEKEVHVFTREEELARLEQMIHASAMLEYEKRLIHQMMEEKRKQDENEERRFIELRLSRNMSKHLNNRDFMKTLNTDDRRIWKKHVCGTLRRRLTDVEKALIVNLYPEKTEKEIALIIGCSQQAISGVISAQTRPIKAPRVSRLQMCNEIMPTRY